MINCQMVIVEKMKVIVLVRIGWASCFRGSILNSHWLNQVEVSFSLNQRAL